MSVGVVKAVTANGYGFITCDESPNKDVFYREAELTGALATRKLHKDDNVEFDMVQTDRGPAAKNMKLVGAESSDQGEQEAA